MGSGMKTHYSMNKTVKVEVLDNGYLLVTDYDKTRKAFKSFEELVNELAFVLSVRDIGEELAVLPKNIETRVFVHCNISDIS